MPELVVSLPAFDSEQRIKRVIESVLAQNDVDFELVIISDGSTDNAARAVRTFQDPRVRLIENKQKGDAPHCHNLVLDQSTAPFVAHLEPSNIVRPGAFRRMLEAFENSNRALVHAYSFELDEDENITRDSFRKRRSWLARNINPQMDYKRALLVYASALGNFRIYRREALDLIGGLDEAAEAEADFDAAIKIADRFEIGLIPEFLYYRISGRRGWESSSRLKEVATLSRRWIHCRRLLKDKKVHFLKDEKYNPNRLLLHGTYEALGLRLFLRSIRGFLRDVPRKLVFRPALVLYYSIISRIPPVSLINTKRRDRPTNQKNLAYYIWHFPVLSQTFINRELAALRRSGFELKIIADEAEDPNLADHNAATLLNCVHYLYPIDRGRLWKYTKLFLVRKPFTYLNLLLFVMTRRHGPYKHPDDDFNLLSKATYLAGVLRDKQIDHIHAPWADQSASIALLASRILGITYSVQARAHDIHRRSSLYTMHEKFEHAEFIITNTRYNENYLQSILKKDHWSRIFTIHNGIDLERFVPIDKGATLLAQMNILCVARLIEQKGLFHLLEACRILKDSQYEFRCEIIGGPEHPLYTNYLIDLRKLHRRLGLEDCVFFLGAQPFHEVSERYRTSDIFVLPCVIAEDGGRDITPNSLIEAMAMGLPVVSTTITGIPEIVEDGISGILVPPRESAALAQAIMRLIQDADLRSKLGAEARKRVEEKFDIDRNIEKYTQLFSSVLADGFRGSAVPPTMANYGKITS